MTPQSSVEQSVGGVSTGERKHFDNIIKKVALSTLTHCTWWEIEKLAKKASLLNSVVAELDN